MKQVLLTFFLLLTCLLKAQVWEADNGDGTYKNPILFADYSDPDVIRVGADYWLVASSFTSMPGIPLLHSKDLVNWRIVNHIYDALPLEKYKKPVHGEGSWAPAIRHHNGMFYVYFCTPYDGLFVARATNPLEKWDVRQILQVEKWEDPCPFWDEDGQAYLIHSIHRGGPAILHKMSPDGLQLLDNGRVVYHNIAVNPVLEGLKIDKRKGWYYIFAPAGGVSTGWQTVLRSRNLYGPYEARKVLDAGNGINGPHQGGLIDTQTGEWWFIHFQSRDAYGRILHLQPAVWTDDDWIVIGDDPDGDGCGIPVLRHKKPDVGKTYPVQTPQTTDEFETKNLGLQWQWNAIENPAWYSLSAKPGFIRLYAEPCPTEQGNLYYAGNLLLQKLPAPAFSATTRLETHFTDVGERAGAIVMGNAFTYIALIKGENGNRIAVVTGRYDRMPVVPEEVAVAATDVNEVWFKIQIYSDRQCSFSYSTDGEIFTDIGDRYPVVPGTWVGGKVGIFSSSPNIVAGKGYADFDYFRLESKIDREALVTRNNVRITDFDTLASLSVGNGSFAFTVDATGLQTFPELYSRGVPLGTCSEWAWHAYPNPDHLVQKESWQNFDFRGHAEPYAVQIRQPGRGHEASEWYRRNPHRMHLGNIGLELTDAQGLMATPDKLSDIRQELDLWNGEIISDFIYCQRPVSVQTVSGTEQSRISASVSSPLLRTGEVKLKLHFPYPPGGHTDDGSDWNSPEKHTSVIIEQGDNHAIIKRILDETVYFVKIQWNGQAKITEKAPHYFVITALSEHIELTCLFADKQPTADLPFYAEAAAASREFWRNYWASGAAVDFSDCSEQRAKELERRVILSQYIMRLNNTGKYPPPETGLVYNSWYGRPHLEMHWWHSVHHALWGRPELLAKSMDWYKEVARFPAKAIAGRQGFDGVRWMKMTDNLAGEAPSDIGSFLIWQQPHFIYYAELCYRANPSPETVDKYKDLVFETAEFMASFVTYDATKDRYLLKAYIPAQETFRPEETLNSPFELAYWYWGLSTAQRWRERANETRDPKWDRILARWPHLAEKDGLYLASENAVDTYENVRFTSDHPMVLGSSGILPVPNLFEASAMKNTFEWVFNHWNWESAWGWDFPMTAMSAVRLGMPEKAIDALLMDKRTNTYLRNGHNYQDERLRIYLPGNGGLLTAVALMCAGWDGSEDNLPGFPKNGQWNVKWEGLQKMP
ncbi:MAG: glycoside hydrolase 43 family protein [Dysgonamonadaceae bacterium]|jgi:beta-xylosidase|nr:glycoside hydrolase 43 family protein [Dysgonamonadaceae bacterium]